MKTIWNVLVFALLINLLAAAGFVGWLRTSGRLNRQRLIRAVEIFKPTVKAEVDAAAARAQEEEETKKKAADLARLQEVSQGPVTTVDRLNMEQQADELAMQKLERLQVEIHDLRDSLAKQNQALAQERQQLDADRQAFDEAKKHELAMRDNEDFKRIVATLEHLEPDQTKKILQDLSAQGKGDQVIEYLAAMNLRSVSAILTEYKTAQEIVEATGLIQALRKRGLNVADPAMRNAEANR